MTKVRTLAGILGQSTVASTGGGGGGATSYDSAGAFPTSGNTAGDLAFATNKKALYNWDGSEWDRVYSGPNETLTWDSALPSTLTFPGQFRVDNGLIDSSLTTLNFSAAADAEGFPVTYSYELTPSNPVQLDSAYSGGTGIVDSSDHPTRPRIRIMPSARDSDEGTFSLRVKATDGTHVISTTSAISLSFNKDVIIGSLFPDDGSSQGFGNRTFTPDPSTNTVTVSLDSVAHSSGMFRSGRLQKGKRYMEIHFSSVASYFMIGLTGSTGNTPGYSDAGTKVIYEQSGTIYGPGAGLQMPGGSLTASSVLGFAWDTDARKVWFRDASGWSPYGDPTGAGSSIAGSAGDDIWMCLGQGSSGFCNGNSFTIKRSSDGFTYPLPTGFSSQ